MLPQHRDDYSLSRFEDAICEVLYRMALNGGADEEDGSVTETGQWSGLLWGPFEESHLIPSETLAAIVQEDSQGFVTYELFRKPGAAQGAWHLITGYTPTIPPRTMEAYELSIRRIPPGFIQQMRDAIPEVEAKINRIGLQEFSVIAAVRSKLIGMAADLFISVKPLPINGLAAAVRNRLQERYPHREFPDLDYFVYELRLAIDARKEKAA